MVAYHRTCALSLIELQLWLGSCSLLVFSVGAFSNGKKKEKNLTIEQRAAVVTLSKEQYYGHAIARKFKVSIWTVQEIFKKAQKTGSIKDRKRSDRPHSTPPRQGHLHYYMSLSNQRVTSRTLKGPGRCHMS